MNEIRKVPGHVIDLVPTILELAGIQAAADHEVPFAGRSLLPSFRQDIGSKRALWWAHEGNHGIRYGDWKLVKTKGGNWELFNLKEDRAENDDLSNEYPQKARDLENSWTNQVDEIRKLMELRH